MNKTRKRPKGAPTPSDRKNLKSRYTIIPFKINIYIGNQKHSEIYTNIESVHDFARCKILKGHDINDLFSTLDIQKEVNICLR